MRNPSGYGSVYKLGGRRRKPWAVRITVGHVDAHYKYKYLGYYATKSEAMIALAEYNKDPYDVTGQKLTLCQVFDRFIEAQRPKVSDNTLRVYQSVYSNTKVLHDIPIADLRLEALQAFFDNSGKGFSSMQQAKNVLITVYNYAEKFELVQKNYPRLVDIDRHKPKEAARPRRIFTPAEIDSLWILADTNRIARIAVMMLYTGVRVSEICDLKQEDVDLEKRCFYIRKAKTSAGVRTVPIAAFLMPHFRFWMDGADEYLIRPVEMHLESVVFRNHHWNRLMDQNGMDHLCHETRHTFISMLANRGVDERVIKAIVGHAGDSVTEAVYTHIDLDTMLAAVDPLRDNNTAL